MHDEATVGGSISQFHVELRVPGYAALVANFIIPVYRLDVGPLTSKTSSARRGAGGCVLDVVVACPPNMRGGAGFTFINI
jgi:hypothetical protein